jgi:hypothetical protein
VNKKNNWKDESLIKLDRNKEYNLHYKDYPKTDYYIDNNNKLNLDMIKNKKKSYTGTHCLRLTNKKRGFERSEKKKNKNMLKNICNEL